MAVSKIIGGGLHVYTSYYIKKKNTSELLQTYM